MKDFTELLTSIISQEIKYIEIMRHSLKENGLMILRLQNKSRFIEKEIEERKQLIEECRVYLRSISETSKARTKLAPPEMQQINTDFSTTNIKLVKGLQKQA